MFPLLNVRGSVFDIFLWRKPSMKIRWRRFKLVMTSAGACCCGIVADSCPRNVTHHSAPPPVDHGATSSSIQTVCGLERSAASGAKQNGRGASCRCNCVSVANCRSYSSQSLDDLRTGPADRHRSVALCSITRPSLLHSTAVQRRSGVDVRCWFTAGLDEQAAPAVNVLQRDDRADVIYAATVLTGETLSLSWVGRRLD